MPRFSTFLHSFGSMFRLNLESVFPLLPCISSIVINSCSSNLFFLIERPRLMSQWLVHWLVLHFPFQCFLLACCYPQIQLQQEIWYRSLACYFRAHCFLDSSAELHLAIGVLFHLYYDETLKYKAIIKLFIWSK